MRRWAVLWAVLLPMLAGAGSRAQGPGAGPVQGQGLGQGAGAFAGMERVVGEVTAVAGATLTVKTEDGSALRIVTTNNTRVMKGRGATAKVAELKVGDGVMAAGNLDAANKTLHAAVLFATDAAQVKAMKENLGKTYIMGRVKAIDRDNAKMTVERPDGVAQTIGFDETTSFRRGRHGGGRLAGDSDAGVPPGGTMPIGTMPETAESLTLADVKVGDAVRGKGTVKGGVFVPTELVVMVPGQGGRKAAAGSSIAPK